METKLYEDLKFCWKAGYKLNQIKEYCNTTLSIDELQTEFKIMWENELQCLKLVKVIDTMELHKQNIAGCFVVPKELLGVGDDNK